MLLFCAMTMMAMTGPLPLPTPPIVVEVSWGGRPPVAMLVDTGAESTTIDPGVAAGWGLKPEFAVELVNLHGTRLVPGLRTRELSIGGTALGELEVLLVDAGAARARAPKVKGVLGANALRGLDYTLLPRKGELQVGAPRPEGVVLPLGFARDRLRIDAKMGTETLRFVLDSGANHVVLFRTPEAMRKTPPVEFELTTIEGARSSVPTTWTKDMVFGDRMTVKMQPAGIVKARGAEHDGLLPAGIFTAIHVDGKRGELVLVR